MHLECRCRRSFRHPPYRSACTTNNPTLCLQGRKRAALSAAARTRSATTARAALEASTLAAPHPVSDSPLLPMLLHFVLLLPADPVVLTCMCPRFCFDLQAPCILPASMDSHKSSSKCAARRAFTATICSTPSAALEVSSTDHCFPGSGACSTAPGPGMQDARLPFKQPPVSASHHMQSSGTASTKCAATAVSQAEQLSKMPSPSLPGCLHRRATLLHSEPVASCAPCRCSPVRHIWWQRVLPQAAGWWQLQVYLWREQQCMLPRW